MNIQAMMKQAQKLQNDMMKEKSQIDEKVFEGKSSFVTVKMKGTKDVIEVKIDADNLEKDDIEMLQDMILVAVNDAVKKVDKDEERNLLILCSFSPINH